MKLQAAHVWTTMRKATASLALASLLAATGTTPAHAVPPPPADTTTPIRHVVVIFQENVSFDHYFATYPRAANPPGEPFFEADPGTPAVNGLTGYESGLNFR